uniref:ESF1 nucleolar pre-rRNA processing protein homolog n=1 Tax=Loxodonta africana TaxID=9785 RepID=G3UCW9_LOXAF
MASKQEIMSDQRFRRVTKDPRFWEMPEKDRKVKIDKRFRAMFHDKKFKLNYAVDKRGRPITHSTTEDLKRYYDLSDSDSDLSDEDSEALNQKKMKKKKLQTKTGIDSKSLVEKKKETEKINQKVAESKNELDNSEIIQKAKMSFKSKKLDSKISPKKDSKEFTQKGRQNMSKAWSPIHTELPGFSSVAGTRGLRMGSHSICSGARQQTEASQEELSEDANEMGDDEESEDESDSGPDLARGKGNVETSSEDEEDEDLLPEELGFEHAWRELDKDAPRANEITHRLAVCNMDWDRLKAKDLLALFSSFKPKGGVVFSVKIYPSEFGKERMKEEQVQGPVELLSIPEDAPEKDWTSREKLRDYQFKRLKYYYAVVDCDSPETASKIYEDCDGLEFESSCSFIDLRFIPDDITFDDEPKDVASEVDLTAYKPKYFTSAAMGTSTVEITWDETDHERITTLNRKFKKEELLDMDFQAYLASSSEDEEKIADDGINVEEDGKTKKNQKDDEAQIAKYRQLLQVIQEKEKKGKENDMEMEIKWVPG